MALFDSIVNSKWFKQKSIILFLNKIDLFRNKLSASPISTHFPEIDCSETGSISAAYYFVRRFREINKTRNRMVYEHFTNATDTRLLKKTMKTIHDIILEKNLGSYMLNIHCLASS